MAYCTTAQLKAYLGIDSEDADDDALIGDCITRAQTIIESHCDRVFEAAADTTRYFDAEMDVDGDTLYLDKDLCQITSVTNGDGTTVAANKYVTQPRNETPYYALKLRVSSDVSWTFDDDPENAIAITGRWAYSVSAPADIEHACIRLAAYLYRQKDNQADLAGSARVGNEGVMLMPSRLPKDVTDLLARYRRLS